MQQQLKKLIITHFKDANTMLHELHKLAPSINFSKPSEIHSIIKVTFSDASHSGGDDAYGQSGIITGLKIDCRDMKLFFPIMGSSHKQRKISYSSISAEILAAADGDDQGYMLKQALSNLLPKCVLKHEILVNTNLLFETITTFYTTGDYRLRHIVSRLRDTFESKKLNSVKWIPGKLNFADGLTKRYILLPQSLTHYF